MSFYSTPVMLSGSNIQLAPSIIEAQQPLGSPINQHFWEWFSGDALDSIWTQNNELGTPIFQMADAIDEGFEIVTDTVETGSMDFNNIRHYSNTSAVFIMAVRKTAGSATDRFHIGLSKDQLNLNTNDRFQWGDSAGSTFKSLLTEDTTTFTIVDSTITTDTVWHYYRGELFTSYSKGYIDSNLEAITTANLPTNTMQPLFRAVQTTGGTNHSTRIKYMEVFNRG